MPALPLRSLPTATSNGMMTMIRANSRAAVLAVGVGTVAVMGTGSAYAYWTAFGSGSGTAAATSAQPLTTTTATASTTSLLYPGGTADVKVTISNANFFPVTVTAMSANGTPTASGGTGTCSPTGVSFTARTGLSIVVPARTGTTNGTSTATLTGAAAMDNTSATGCQGATFSLPVTFTAASS